MKSLVKVTQSKKTWSYVTFAPSISPTVTAGLTWHPDTWPIVAAMVATVRPKHREILTMLAWSLRLPPWSPPTQLQHAHVYRAVPTHSVQPAASYEYQDQGTNQLSSQTLEQQDRPPQVRQPNIGHQGSAGHDKMELRLNSVWDRHGTLGTPSYLLQLLWEDAGQSQSRQYSMWRLILVFVKTQLNHNQ